jgi:SAM-dependent MidA family methyltransferase
MTWTGFLPWSAAMESALYGPHGFYRTRGGPAAHFRTSVHASPLFATAIVQLLREVDAALGHPDEITLIDMGAGRGELLASVQAQLADAQDFNDPPTNDPHTNDPHTSAPLADRLRLIAVELADRPDNPPPDNLTTEIEWRNELADPDSLTGLLIANEWLDNVPCDVVQATPDGWRSVEVAVDGAERLGAPPSREQQAWLSTWWPTDGSSDPVGPPQRAEVGLARDAAWRKAVATLTRGVAIAVDYAHIRAARPRFGALTGYAHGRQTAPVPDGSCDITAHVALDACAAAARAEWTVQSDQRTVFHSLGITGARPELALASSDPRGYLRALSQASAAAELTDAEGLGGFGWLAQGVSLPMLPSLARVTRSR